MVDIFSYFNNNGVSNQDIFLYISIFIVVLVFFSQIIEVKLFHILSLLTFILIVYTLSQATSQDTEAFNETMEFQLNSLDSDSTNTNYFYLDVDLIGAFYNLKMNYSNFNKRVYIRALQCANNVLRIRSDMEKDICILADPIPSFINLKEFSKKRETKCGQILENSTQNLQVAEEQMRLCLNYLEALKLKIPVSNAYENEYDNVLNTIHLLLKRNLDIIVARIDNVETENIETGYYDNIKPFDYKKSGTNKTTSINFDTY